MNVAYAYHALGVLLLTALGGMLLWSVGFAFYLNRIHSHGWASTRRLLRTLTWVGPIALVLCGFLSEDFLVPTWILASLGRPAFQLELARRCAIGDHLLARNEAMTRRWLTPAARSGNAQARLELAGMDWQGQGLLKPDPAAALGWARLAAGQGLPEARLFAGEILLRQPELAEPREKAQTFFDQALPQFQSQAADGNPNALFSLGLMKIQGHGLAVDVEGGFRLLLQAQARGLNASQQLTLSILRTTLPPDLVQRAEKPKVPIRP